MRVESALFSLYIEKVVIVLFFDKTQSGSNKYACVSLGKDGRKTPAHPFQTIITDVLSSRMAISASYL